MQSHVQHTEAMSNVLIPREGTAPEAIIVEKVATDRFFRK